MVSVLSLPLSVSLSLSLNTAVLGNNLGLCFGSWPSWF